MATKKKIKTYGVRGLMEWVCNIPVGKSHMRIEFTGGILTSYGNTPAKYVTKDLLQQTIIEHSDFFKKKRIVLLSVVETDEDEDKLPKHAEAAEHPVNSSDDDDDDDDDDEDIDTSTSDESEDVEAAPQVASNDDDTEQRTPDGKLIVKVTSLDDAKSYLNEKCGIAVRELRSRAKIVEAAEANGVSFEGI
jgi:hypothetical protein